jgi:hypothetical protein
VYVTKPRHVQTSVVKQSAPVIAPHDILMLVIQPAGQGRTT